MAIITEAVDVIKQVAQIFKPADPSPEEQRAKAGTWYAMLQDVAFNNPSDSELRAVWYDRLPLRQRRTKDSVFDNHINGKSQTQQIDYLVGKINDELVKGGFSAQSKTSILDGMGASTLLSAEPAQKSIVSAGATSPLIDKSVAQDEDPREGQMYFYILGLVLVVAGTIAYLFAPVKRRRR